MALGIDDRPRNAARSEVAVEMAIVFGFGCQLALLAFFAAHRWWPAREWALGRLVYGLGILAALLALVLLIVGPAWPWALALRAAGLSRKATTWSRALINFYLLMFIFLAALPLRNW